MNVASKSRKQSTPRRFRLAEQREIEAYVIERERVNDSPELFA
jgi:hypothetical protein